MLDIIYKDGAVVAVVKPPNVPTQSDPGGDKDVMTMLSEQLSASAEQSALWLVHRLDRVVGGVVVFARNKKAAALLSDEISNNRMVKEYFAVVEGVCEGGVMEDYLYKDARLNKAFVVKGERRGVKWASLECTPLATVSTERGERTLVRVRLNTGRFHQIRAQLSSRATPICGDGKYGSRDNGVRFPALFAAHLSFKLEGREYSFDRIPDTDAYPWSLFKEVIK